MILGQYELGKYDFDNFILLNPSTLEKDLVNTAVHEHTHRMLSQQSIYGITQYCLKRIDIPINYSNDINIRDVAMKFLASRSKKVQECVATFFEASYFMIINNDEYNQFIENLKNENKEYYKYLKPLLFILEYMENVSYEYKLKIAHAVFMVALKSMNAEIYNLEGELFTKNSSLKKLVSTDGFAKKYLPYTRFKNEIKDFKDEITNGHSCNKLLDFAKTENEEFNEDLLVCRLAKAKEFILNIFDNSPHIVFYKNQLSHIFVNKDDSLSLFKQQLPIPYSADSLLQKSKIIDSKLLVEKCKIDDATMLFLIGNLVNNLKNFLTKSGAMQLADIEDTRESILFYELRSRKVSFFLLEGTDLRRIIEQKNNRCVLLTYCENYDYKNDCILNSFGFQGNIYIYCDKTYEKATKYFDSLNNKTVLYRYMVYKGMYVLVAKINENTRFILPMTQIVAEDAEGDICQRYKNIHFVYGNEECAYDQYVITDEKIRDDIDTIINCLYFYDVTPSDLESLGLNRSCKFSSLVTCNPDFNLSK